MLCLYQRNLKEMEKLGLEIRNSEHKEGRIYDMLVQPEINRKKLREN